jgi:hypothetical protein
VDQAQAAPVFVADRVGVGQRLGDLRGDVGRPTEPASVRPSGPAIGSAATG